MVYKILSVFILSIIYSCSTVSFHPSNLKDNQLSLIENGMHKNEVYKYIRKHPIEVYNHSKGEFTEIYTADYTSGNMIYCRNLAVYYNNRGIVSGKKFVNLNAAQQRCNSFSQASVIQANQNQQFFNSLSNSLAPSTQPVKKVKCQSRSLPFGQSETTCEESQY